MNIRSTTLTAGQVASLKIKLQQGNVIVHRGEVLREIFILGDKVVLVMGKGVMKLPLVAWLVGWWRCMLNRAYRASSSKWYNDVTVSESFKHYHIFKQWYLTQYLEEGWELDKDLLLKGNKVYCASRCCFLPKEINSALAINRSLIPILAEKYRKVLNNDIYKALLLFTVN